jgi:Lrp/AsnC family leucine-responsive transcriptional regulator
MSIDEIDKKILDILFNNGRIPYSTLAKELGLSRVAVRKRITQLLKEGVIEKFTIAHNPEKVGKKVSAFFEVDCEPTALVSVAKLLAENPKVASCYQMTGPSTIHMHLLVDDFSMLEDFINKELYSLEGIVRVESHILLRRFKTGSA